MELFLANTGHQQQICASCVTIIVGYWRGKYDPHTYLSFYKITFNIHYNFTLLANSTTRRGKFDVQKQLKKVPINILKFLNKN